MISTAARILRLLACAALLVTGCATYRFGNGTLYAPDVRTVYVPMFQSDSYRTTPSVDVGPEDAQAPTTPTTDPTAVDKFPISVTKNPFTPLVQLPPTATTQPRS